MTLIGRVLADRYEILEEIGSGGMAVVYKAKCRLLNRYVAIKVLRPDLQNDEEFVRRFNVEAQSAASLTHPNIVSIFDVGYEDGLHYIVMEYIEGVNLKDYIEEKRILPWREAVDYTIQIAKGLEQAHKNSIIHRDVKPQNIIMTADGVMKVTDFGIARANVKATVTCEDTAIGSVHYISPEQARGGYTDERSDIYSLGVVLYEMITGQVPFDSDRPVTVAIMHLQSEPVMPRELNLSIPLPLEKIVMKAMSKEVSSRYSHASDFISDLIDVLHDPSREIRSKDEEKPLAQDLDATKVMPAVKLERMVKEPEVEMVEEKVQPKEKTVSAPAPKEEVVEEIDKKKEKKVIAFAITSAVVMIAVIFIAFASMTGMFSFISSSGGTVEIPNIEGMHYDDAVKKYVESADENAEYRFNIIKGRTVESEEEEGTILSQDPVPKSKVKMDEVIIITVELSEGDNEIRLKNFTKYEDKREVEIEINRLDLKAEFIEEFSDDIPKGMIIEQDPAPGTYVKKGDRIKFYVSKGPEEEPEDDPSTNPPSGNNDNPSGGTEQQPEAPKKSTMLTIYGPKDKDSAIVQVNVNGAKVYSKTLRKGQSDVVELKSASSSVEVEILYDGVSQQKGTVRLH